MKGEKNTGKAAKTILLLLKVILHNVYYITCKVIEH